MEYSIYWLTIIHIQAVTSTCSIFLEISNYSTDLSKCHQPTPAVSYGTFETCMKQCVASRNCSAIIFNTSLPQTDCCLLPNTTSLLVWQGSLTIYHKKSIMLRQKFYFNPCGSPWNAPAGWDITRPATHVDFTNTDCLQTFNGANVVSLCHKIVFLHCWVLIRSFCPSYLGSPSAWEIKVKCEL